MPTTGAMLPLLAVLPPQTRESLFSASTVRRIAAGETICRQGEPADRLAVVEAGRIRVDSVTASGRELLIGVFQAPVAFDKVALIHRTGHTATARAVGAARVRVIPGTRFEAAVAGCPPAAQQLMRHLAAVARERHERLVDFAGLDVVGRLARWLLQQADRHDPDGVAVPLSLTQTDLAGLLGTSRVSVNRALRELATDGAIRRTTSGVVILRPGDLAARL